MLISLITGYWALWIPIIGVIILLIYMPRIKGAIGEKSVALFLSNLDKSKYKLINNLMLQIGGKTTQIDHVVVSNYGIFVIESKNYKGWIIGNEYDDYWKQVIYKRKEKLYNPIRQNYGHIKVLQQVLSQYPQINFISIVAFTTRATLKVNTKTHVTYTLRLPKIIKQYTEERISDDIKEQIYAKLISLNVDSKENRAAHIHNIKSNIAHKNANVNNNICPRCGGSLVIKKGKYGQFKGCSNYPKCRFTADIR